MASLEIQGDALLLRMTAGEKLAALRGDVRVPLAAIRAISVEPQPWSALCGIRAPGTGIPGVVAYGVRRDTGGRPHFAAVHGRGAAVRVELNATAPYSRLLVTVEDPAEVVARLVRATAP